ncbi:MAG: DNA repair protein RecN [Tissierellia bacterium]|nr:DNA repair protein RecN [Tissierellia bacterium]
MLTNLYIKNFALFDELSVDFDEGLNIISGETGSGKSILINAISLLLQGRINKNFIGNFSNETIVEASFSLENDIKDKLETYDIKADDNLIITRRFTKTSSTIKLNNRPINLAILEDIGQSIMDIHGQHSQLVVLNKSNYLKIIDSFNEKTILIKQALKNNMASLKKLQEKLETIDLNEDEVFRETDILKFQVEEIEAFDFKNYDEISLNKEHKKLSNLTDILSSIKFIQSILSDGYHKSSLKDEINEIYSKLLDVNEFDEDLKAFTSRILDIKDLINEFSRDVDSYFYSIDLDEERLAEIDQIFSNLHVLKRKYGPEIEDILAFLSRAKERLIELKDIEEIRAKILIEIDKINKKNKHLSQDLTEIRKNIISFLEKSMIEELSQMNMTNLSFKILLEDKGDIDETGQDQIDFLISTNKGQDMRSLNKVVSGGEISRFMLALKAVLADSEEVQTIVFDEIDTGISGFTADVVGDKLVNISKKRQLLVITHLPQIASKADNHYLIEKWTDDKFTKSSVKKLNDQDRIKEVARLISGANITDSSLNSASELIKNAKR